MKFLKNQEGAALVYVIVVMMVVFLLVGGIATVSMSENRQAMYQVEEMTSYYIARAGAESMASELKRMSKTKLEQFTLGEQQASASNVLAGEGDVEIFVSYDSADEQYIIRAVGTYERAESTVRIRMSYSDQTDLDYAAYAIDDMGAPGGASDAISVGTITGTIASGGDIHYKQADVNNGGLDEDLIQPNWNEDVDIYVPDLVTSGILVDFDLVDNPNTDLIVNESTVFTNFSMNNKDLTIDTDNAEYKQDNYDDFDTHFTMSEGSGGSGGWLIINFQGEAKLSGDISVSGSNNLMIVVNDAFYFNGELEILDDVMVEIYVVDESSDTSQTDNAFRNNHGDDYDLVIEGNKDLGIGPIGSANPPKPDNLMIYIYGSLDNNEDIEDYNTVSMNNNSDLYGFILGPEAVVHLKKMVEPTFTEVFMPTKFNLKLLSA